MWKTKFFWINVCLKKAQMSCQIPVQPMQVKSVCVHVLVCVHLCHLSYISLSCFCLREHNQVVLLQIKSLASL